jgi:hypothetical protein
MEESDPALGPSQKLLPSMRSALSKATRVMVMFMEQPEKNHLKTELDQVFLRMIFCSVERKAFMELCDNVHPLTGKLLTQRLNSDGNRRVFFDSLARPRNRFRSSDKQDIRQRSVQISGSAADGLFQRAAPT